jgi:hypothetical protein
MRGTLVAAWFDKLTTAGLASNAVGNVMPAQAGTHATQLWFATLPQTCLRGSPPSLG